MSDAANAAVDATLMDLAANVLALLKDAIESVEIDSKDFETQLRQRCLLYFAKKMYRVTLAGVTLVQRQQSSVAFTLKRDQHYAWVAFHYYLSKTRQSILFAASGPLRQRDKAKEIMDFDPAAAADSARQNQLRDLEKMADALYAKFPDLKVPKGNSGATNNPVFIDWSEPSEYAMAEAIVRTWPDEMRKEGKPVPPDDELEEWIRQQLRFMQFYHASFPSQDMHGTPMGLMGDLSDEEQAFSPSVNVDSHEPNGLIYIYLWYPLGLIRKLVEFSGATGFTDRFTKIIKAAEKFRPLFGGNSDDER